MSNQGTATKKQRFLEAYVDKGTVRAGCLAAGLVRQTIYKWLKRDQPFQKAFDEARADATDKLEEEARRRAVDGTIRPVYHQGKMVGGYREHSDTLLIFLLKGAKPDVYRERFEHTGKDGGPIQHATLDLTKIPTDELKQVAEILRKGKLGGDTGDT